MRRWDLLLVVALVAGVVAASGVDWRFGVAVGAVELVLVWWLFGPLDDGEV